MNATILTSQLFAETAHAKPQVMAKFRRIKKLSPWRKLALVFWGKPGDPSVYGWYDVDVTIAQEYLKKINATSATKVTLTHYFAKALAVTIAKHPMVNGIIKWGTIYQRDSVDLFLQVAIPSEDSHLSGDHLSGAKITDADKKSVSQIAEELSKTAIDIRDDRDPQFQKQFALAQMTPAWLLKIFVKIHGFLLYNLNISMKSLGFFPDPFGSAMLTSVGTLDAPPGLAPIVPPSRCPLLICLGRVEKKPWVVGENEIAVRPIASFTCTFDHRFLDGLTASKMFKTFMEILYHPDENMSLS